MKHKDDKEVWITCDCFSPEHIFRLTVWRWTDGSSDMYAEVHLNKHPFWKRVWTAIKYVFGYQCRYGAFDEFIINQESAQKIKEVTEEYLKLTQGEKQ